MEIFEKQKNKINNSNSDLFEKKQKKIRKSQKKESIKSIIKNYNTKRDSIITQDTSLFIFLKWCNGYSEVK